MTTKKLCFILSIFLFGAYLGAPAEVYAQVAHHDTSEILPEVQIISSKIRQHVVGSMRKTWDTDHLEKLPTNNLAQLLNAETGTYVKSYGQGSLATTSIRGGSAGHTLVLWNGLPIQSPMLGQLDLALLPQQTAESISFTKGGNAAMWGSGAIGGVINLQNEADYSNKLRIKSGTQVGSFGQFQQQLNIALGNSKVQSVTKFSHQQAKNDFHYFLADGLPERQQTNAELSQQYIGQDLYWKINNRNHVEVHAWLQQSDRQIPPTNVQNRSLAHQDDASSRFVAEYKRINPRSLYNAKVGYFDEHLDYFDDLILLESRSHFRTYLAELTGQWFWKKHEFIVGNFHTQTRAWSAGYRETTPDEYKTALFASWLYNADRWKYQLSLRQEMVDGDLVPLVPTFGFHWQATDALAIRAKISRNYRLPTFNDRFWMPGGNPDLLPESGWSQELTVGYEMKNDKFTYTLSLTAFNRSIDNWILWSIREGQSFWSANNITKVWSRGLEPRLGITYRTNNIELQCRAGYDYIRSTNQVALENPKMAKGDQLVYTPEHQAFGTVSMDWHGFHMAYQHTYKGATSGINDMIDAYHVGNIRLQYDNIFQQFNGTFFLNINNVWDADYLVVERRPMPGIHFLAGINITFHKTK